MFKLLSKISKIKFLLLFILRIYLIEINCRKLSLLYESDYAKAYKLNNGNIILAGTNGINVYDSSGVNLLYNITTDGEDKINIKEDAFFTTFTQFETGEEYGIIIVKQVVHILNNKGELLFKFRLTHDTSKIQFYTLVPYIYGDNNYNFILGFLNQRDKAYLQYYSINFDTNNLTLIDNYEFNEDNFIYGYGISCQIMNHNTNGNVLTCFYLIYKNTAEIGSISFILNNNIEKIPMFNDTYYDKSFIIQSTISPDKKKSLVCYARNKDQEQEENRDGICSVYDIDKNKFEKQNKYLSKSCGTSIEHINLDYFKETREYIFSCTNPSSSKINIVKFDQNFDVINIGSESNDSYILFNNSCQSIYFYNFLFLSNEYKLIAQLICNNQNVGIELYSIPKKFEPKTIYSNSTTTDKNNVSPINSPSSNIESSKCDLYKNNEGTICLENVPNGYYILDKLNKIIEKCHITCNTCEKRPTDDSNNCASCKENFKLNNNNNCIYKYNYYFDNVIKEIIYLLADEFCPEKLPYEIIETKECVETCTNEEFINKKCKINKFSENNINIITEKLRSLINEVTDSNYDVIIDGNNIIYEVTTSSTKKEHRNVSLIDFGECEKILKEKYEIDYLLIFKMDVKLNDSYPTFVEYEVYSPENKTKLDLSFCENTQIDIYVPLNLDNDTNDLYNSMNKNGFDIFNVNNSFYNDVCIPFTSNDGTDMTLNDRQNTYYNDNITLCESSCIYKSYNSTNGKAKCQCSVKTNITEMKTISYDKIDIDVLLDIKTFSNIELIKCFKLTFSKEGLNKNYGSLIIIIMTTIFISLIITNNLNQRKYISKIIRLALKANNVRNPIRKKNSRNKLLIYNNNQSIRNLIETNSNKSKNKIKKKSLFQIQNYNNINIIRNTNIILGNDKKAKIKYNKHVVKKTISRKSNTDIEIYPFKEKKNIIGKLQSNNLKGLKYNDLELNTLLYEEAILIDKRTYWQYYLSLIKTKHIVLFIFIPYNDYNLITIKISLFIFNFCLYFTVNAFFFTDSTMHKIYKDKGFFDIANQLPHILYSTLISAFINMGIKKLALSDKTIIGLKRMKINREEMLKKSCELYKTLMIRFNLFFFIGFLFLAFFWYYISAFCAVYKNTQTILIENTLMCFLFTLIYPFIFSLLPGIFRIPSLKKSKENKQCLYTIGNILALL